MKNNNIIHKILSFLFIENTQTRLLTCIVALLCMHTFFLLVYIPIINHQFDIDYSSIWNYIYWTFKILCLLMCFHLVALGVGNLVDSLKEREEKEVK